MFELLNKVSGVVVLHDFFLSDAIASAQADMPSSLERELYFSHGYPALQYLYNNKKFSDVLWKYPCNLRIIQHSLGIVVHSPTSLQMAKEWYGGEPRDWHVIPLMRNHEIDELRFESRAALGFYEDDFVVCSFGILGPGKLNHALVEAWGRSSLSKEKNCHLVFVGENHPSEYGKTILESIKSFNIHITGWVDNRSFKDTWLRLMSAYS